MKVTGPQPPRTSELTTGKSREAEQQQHAEQPRREDAERAQSGRNRTSLTMTRIREVIRNTPDVRADRVEAVREKLRNGQFQVDPERLARNIIAESLREDVEEP